MGLKVIGAGFGRTGTESLKKALEILGFGPCYHMYEVLPEPERVATWRRVAAGDTPNWDAIFDGFHSAVDWPTARYWRELSEHFPQAKIILSVRDAGAWYRSMDETILEAIRNSDDPNSIGARLLGQHVFGGKFDNRDHVISVFERNTRDVQAAFAEDRLLTYELGAGWGPLCAFLGCEVPDQDYPRGNTVEEFTSSDAELNARKAAREQGPGST